MHHTFQALKDPSDVQTRAMLYGLLSAEGSLASQQVRLLNMIAIYTDYSCRH